MQANFLLAFICFAAAAVIAQVVPNVEQLKAQSLQKRRRPYGTCFQKLT